MIIETPYKQGDTVSIKLTSGEELVARLEADSEKSYKIKKPLMLVAQGAGMGLAPFMFTVSPDSTIDIKKSAVTCVVKTAEDMSKQYIQSTTGIAV
jgi:hypothetical protein